MWAEFMNHIDVSYKPETVKFKFRHRIDKDYQIEKYTLTEIVFGIGKTKQSIKDIIMAWNADGYILVDMYIEEKQ